MGAQESKPIQSEREGEEQQRRTRAQQQERKYTAARALAQRYREGRSAAAAASKAREDHRRVQRALAGASAAARATAVRLRQAKMKMTKCNIGMLEKEARAAADRERELVGPYEVLGLAAERLSHSCHEPQPDTRERVLKQLPSGMLFMPVQKKINHDKKGSGALPQHNPVEQQWEQIARGMVHASRLRQEQQREEAARERLVDESCIGRLGLFQEFRRRKETLEEDAKSKKYLATPVPRSTIDFRRRW
eukprot:TRINITY_DN12505_c0_g1_i3.p2 TRINITY_DN12505_c0_g1~~TRINITY_DN12505_c0_g1_i3.p2  ORF type:complete len:249 (+),score=103.33 TRINITY_DN12505_c0_g1_i3:110-856(+)